MCERTELQFMQDILESLNAAMEYVIDDDLDSFSNDRKTKSATIRELEIIGEAASRISTEKKAEYSDVPWRLLKDFRNVLSHEYFGVNDEVVFDIVRHKLPKLKIQMEEIVLREIELEKSIS